MATNVTDNMPSISSSAYCSTATPLGYFGGNNQSINTGFATLDSISNIPTLSQNAQVMRHLAPKGPTTIQPQQKELPMANQLRMVQVLIADPNDNLPLEKRLLFKGEPKLTDATDQELFFELDIKTLLEEHNKLRVKIVDKKVKERTEYLEPVKVRELKMVVVEIAKF